MESKSVKEIVNILNRDLASINVRGHNLREQESSHIATQPFENWLSWRKKKTPNSTSVSVAGGFSCVAESGRWGRENEARRGERVIGKVYGKF
jgi:hypothetical protein